MSLHRQQSRVLAVVVVVTTTASVGLNIWFWSTRSSGAIEALLAGAIAGALDIVKVIAAGTVASVWARGTYGAATIVTGLLVLGIVSSGLASVGFFFTNKAATVDVAQARGALYRDRLQSLAHKRTQWAALGIKASSAELLAQQEQVLARVPQRQRDQSRCRAQAISNDCTELRELTVTLERTRRGEILAREIRDLEQLTAQTIGDAAHVKGDGQIELLAKMFNQPHARVEFALAVLFALLVEGVTAGAPFMASVLNMPSAMMRMSSTIRPEREVLDDFMAFALIFDGKKNARESELIAALSGYCAAHNLTNPHATALVDLMLARGAAPMKLRGEAGFSGVGLKHGSA